MRIDRRMKRPPSTAVERVRKSAAPRAVMKPEELPPTPRPPPSERCMRMVQINEIAMSAWTISKNANIDELSREKTGAAPLSRHRAGFQPTLGARKCSKRLDNIGQLLL